MNRNYSIIAGVGLVIVVLVAGFFVLQGQQGSVVEEKLESKPGAVGEQPTNQTTPVVNMEAVEVDYLDNGFSPNKVTIKKGQTVKFVNKTADPMDAASDPHPVHTDYPEFDQGRSSEAGTKEYSFTFEKVGMWGYHNHQNPAHRGTVEVTE